MAAHCCLAGRDLATDSDSKRAKWIGMARFHCTDKFREAGPVDDFKKSLYIFNNLEIGVSSV